MQILRGRAAAVNQLLISSDSRYLLAGLEFCHVWDLNGPKAKPLTVAVKSELNRKVYDAQFLNPTQLLVRTFYPFKRHRYDIETGETIDLADGLDGICDDIHIHPSGEFAKVRVVPRPDVLEVWTCRILRDGFAPPDAGTPRPLRGRLRGLSPAGAHYLVEATPQDHACGHHLHDTATDARVTTFERPKPTGSTVNYVRTWCFSPDGRSLYFAESERLDRHDCAAGGLPAVVATLSGREYGDSPPLAAHPDGRVLAVVEDGRAVTFRDADTLEVLRSYDFAMPKVTCVAFTPDGMRCVLGNSRGKVLLFDID